MICVKQFTNQQLTDPYLIERGIELAGNWKKFNSFSWSRCDEDQIDNWFIYSASHRDSDLIAQSNYDVLCSDLKEYEFNKTNDVCDITFETFNDWAYGYTNNICVRVFEDANRVIVTPAFAMICELLDAILEYPILDEEDYSEKQYEAAMTNIHSFGSSWLSRNAHRYEMKEKFVNDWEERIYRYFRKEFPEVLEDDQNAGCASDSKYEEAFRKFKIVRHYVEVIR